MKISTLERLIHLPPTLEHLYHVFDNWMMHYISWKNGLRELRFHLPSTLRLLMLHCRVDCRLNLKINLPVLEDLELYNCRGPVFLWVKSSLLISNCPRTAKDHKVAYGVRKLQTDFNLKEYPDSILELEIMRFDPRTNLRYLRLHWRNVLNIKDIELPASFYKLSGNFAYEQLQEYNLKARKQLILRISDT